MELLELYLNHAIYGNVYMYQMGDNDDDDDDCCGNGDQIQTHKRISRNNNNKYQNMNTSAV